jgi:predicted DNA-binding ribbon-helix-helix protein
MKQKKVGDEKITFALKQMADLYRLISVLLTDIPTGERHMSSSDLVAAIDSDRQHGNLSSAIRLFVLDFHRAQRSEADRRHGPRLSLTHRWFSAAITSRRPRRSSRLGLATLISPR